MADVTIVTISFNQLPYLRECIDSVLCQKNVDVEYIVVDAGSTDGSRELILSYGQRIHRIFEQDEGPADGLRKGFERASAPILGFLNSDDILLPDALSKIRHLFEESPFYSLIAGAGYIIDENSNKVRRVHPTIFSPRPYVYGAVTVLQQSTFFTRASYEEVGGFNTLNRTCWDAELFLDITLAGGRMRVIRDYLSGFRIHAQSISGSGRLNAQYHADNRRLFEKVIGRPRGGIADRLRQIYYRLGKWATL